MKILWMRFRRFRSMSQKLAVLRDENRVLKKSLMRQPNIHCVGDYLYLHTVEGHYRVFKRVGTTETPMG